MKKLETLGIKCGHTMTAGKIEAARKEDLPESVLAELCPGLTLNRAAMVRIAAEIEKAGKTKPKKAGKK